MISGRLGRWASGGLLLPGLLVVAGCSDRKPPADQGSFEENASDMEPVIPPPTRVSPAPPAVVRVDTPRIPRPEEAPSQETQMQDDAAASGMTSPIPDTAENAEPPGPENSS